MLCLASLIRQEEACLRGSVFKFPLCTELMESPEDCLELRIEAATGRSRQIPFSLTQLASLAQPGFLVKDRIELVDCVFFWTAERLVL